MSRARVVLPALLRATAVLGVVLGVVLVPSCAGTSRPVDPKDVPLESTPDAAQGPTAEPRTCLRASDCGAGEDCAGEQGCDAAWTCQPARPCSRDAVPYCTCDGRTVTGSSHCPPEPYRARGACPAPASP
jgi:hypothetical protein